MAAQERRGFCSRRGPDVRWGLGPATKLMIIKLRRALSVAATSSSANYLAGSSNRRRQTTARTSRPKRNIVAGDLIELADCARGQVQAIRGLARRLGRPDRRHLYLLTRRANFLPAALAALQMVRRRLMSLPLAPPGPTGCCCFHGGPFRLDAELAKPDDLCPSSDNQPAGSGRPSGTANSTPPQAAARAPQSP